MEILIILVVVLVLDVAAWRWGVDNRGGQARPEWKRRTFHDFARPTNCATRLKKVAVE